MNQKSNKIRNYRLIFIFAAIFNFLSVIMFLINYDLLFKSFGYNLSFDLVWTTQFLGFITIFGIGYLILGFDPLKNTDIALLGAIGKFFVFTVFLIFTILLIIPPAVTLITIIDVIFAILFIEYFIYMKKNENKNS
ncbi:MAG: hypothetical protein EAX96_00585 [Candidatus Lokiarchaeota archaeon]|nr:hypothetical protein [Candidatus Lokiarchaeota archaeon]